MRRHFLEMASRQKVKETLRSRNALKTTNSQPVSSFCARDFIATSLGESSLTNARRARTCFESVLLEGAGSKLQNMECILCVSKPRLRKHTPLSYAHDDDPKSVPHPPATLDYRQHTSTRSSWRAHRGREVTVEISEEEKIIKCDARPSKYPSTSSRRSR